MGHASPRNVVVEAASQVQAEGAPVLLVVYDLPYPPPFYALRPFAQPFAVAFDCQFD